MSRFTSYLLVAAAAVLWGSTSVAVYFAISYGMGMLSTATIMSSLGSLILILYAGRKGFSMIRIDLIIYGALFVSLFRILYVLSISINGAGITASLLYIAPILVALMSPFFLNESVSFLEIVLAVVAVSGAYILSNPNFKIASITGFLIGMLLAFVYAITIIAIRLFYKKGYSAKEIMTQPALSSIPILIGVTVFLDPKIELNFITILSLLWGGIVCVGFAFLLYLNGMRNVKALEASVIATMEPVSALLLAYFILGEKYSWLQIIGISMILFSSTAIILRNVHISKANP